MIKTEAHKLISKYYNELKSYFTVSPIETKSYNFECTIIESADKVKLQVYFGKKGVKTVLQGNSSSALYSKINSLINGNASKEKQPGELNEPECYIGSDESGKGDYFGPLVTAAVFVNNKTSAELKRIGVKDSKELTDEKINNLADEILNVIGNNYSIKILIPIDYNKEYQKFNNLNKLLRQCHFEVLSKLTQKTSCTKIIVDKFSNEIINITNCEVIQTTKAERFTAVAAASILARSRFNDWFIKKDIDGLYIPKGAVSGIVETGKMLVDKFGIDSLKQFGKLHFKTTKQILI